VNRIRVALVAPTHAFLGGHSVQADRLVRCWRDDPEYDVFQIRIDPPFPGPLDRVRALRGVRTAVRELLYWRELVEGIQRADIIHVFSAAYRSFLLASLPAVAAARLLGRPVVFNYRSGHAVDHLRRSALLRAVLMTADVNVVASRFLARVFGRIGAAARTIPNVVDTTQFRFVERPARADVLSTRNFERRYNVACTLRAFQLVQDRVPHATLTLVGSGPEERALKKLAADLRLSSVRFVGPVAPDRMSSHYARAGVYVQTSDVDNMPNSLLEAFASGLPAVATRAGGVSAMARHGVHALLARRGDHVEVAHHVLELLADNARGVDLARAARGVADRGAWEHVGPLWRVVYHEARATQLVEVAPQPA